VTRCHAKAGCGEGVDRGVYGRLCDDHILRCWRMLGVCLQCAAARMVLKETAPLARFIVSQGRHFHVFGLRSEEVKDDAGVLSAV